MLKSFLAVVFGAVISLIISLLVVFGILAPVLTAVFGLKPSQSVVTQFVPLLVFVAAFAFYFGGMAAGYKAPFRRRLHGVAVALLLFVLSPALNLAAGRVPFPQFHTLGTTVLALILLAVSFVAAYVGAGRGATLWAVNEEHNRKRLARERYRREKQAREEGAPSGSESP